MSAPNAGGPHCLALGVTSAHVLAVEVVLTSGEAAVLGDPDGWAPGLDLRGAFVGSEGMLGITTAIAVRLTPNPPSVQTLLLAFDSVDTAAQTVSAVIADGIVPAAIEMMDKNIIWAVENFAQAGFPTDAAAVVIVEVDGLPGGVAADADRVAELAVERGGRVRRAANDHERALIWKGRKSAFGAIAQIKPNYYLHDTVVPRTRLAEVMNRVYEIVDEHDLQVMNVFHAGDGNLHPLLLYDRREPGIMEAGAGRRVSHHRGFFGRWRRTVGRARHRHRKARLHASYVQRGRSRCPGTAADGPSTPKRWPTLARCCPPGQAVQR